MAEKGLIQNGVLYALDAAGNKLTKLTVVEDINFTDAQNVTEVTTTSGRVLKTFTNQRASITGTLYTPRDAEALSLLFRGAITVTTLDGSTAIAGKEAVVKFPKANDAILLPVANADKSAATVNSIKLTSNPTTTYTVSTDYTVSVDSVTGLTLIKHVSGGSIPVDTEVTVNFDVTPAASSLIEPIAGGTLIPNTFVVVETNPDDTAKTAVLVVPAAVPQTDIELPFLILTDENASPNVMNFTLQQEKRDVSVNHINWAMVDMINA